jgi:hypothetical protein
MLFSRPMSYHSETSQRYLYWNVILPRKESKSSSCRIASTWPFLGPLNVPFSLYLFLIQPYHFYAKMPNITFAKTFYQGMNH